MSGPLAQKPSCPPEPTVPPIPFLGLPAFRTEPAGGGGCGCDAGVCPVPADESNIVETSSTCGGSTTPSGYTPGPGGDALRQAADVPRVAAGQTGHLPGGPALAGHLYNASASIKPATGSLTIQVALPSVGGFPSGPFLTYDRAVANDLDSEFGRGWVAALQRQIVTSGGDVSLITSDGRDLPFEPASGSYYEPVGGGTSRLESLIGGAWVEHEASGQLCRYDSNTPHRLRYIQSPSGKRCSLTRSGVLLTRTIDPFGRITTFVYDGFDKIRGIIDPFGRITSFTVDESGDLIRIVFPDESEVSMTYEYAEGAEARDADPSPRHSLAAWTNPDGTRTSYVSDPGMEDYSWLGTVLHPDGTRTSLTYYEVDEAGSARKTALVDPAGNRHTYLADAIGAGTFGNITSIIGPDGKRTSAVWDSLNRLIAVVNGLGDRTSFTHTTTADGFSRFTSVVRPIADTGFQFLYDSAGRVRRTVDALGRMTSLVWDAFGRRSVVIDALGGRTSTIYNADGQIAAVADPLDQRISFLYDAQGRRSVVIDACARRTTSIHDGCGRVVSVVDPLGRTTSMRYDLMNRPLVSIDALGNRTSTTYDEMGRPISVEDPLNRISRTRYDIMGRPTASISPLDLRTSYGYDELGRKITVEDPLERVVTTLYDECDCSCHPVATVDPLDDRSTTIYDDADNVVATANPLDERTSLIHDANGRTVVVIDPLNRKTTSVYDAVGNRIVVKSPYLRIGTFVFSRAVTTVYDKLNRPVVVIDPLNRRSTTVLDPAGRIVAVVDALNRRTTTVHSPCNLVLAVVDPLLHRWSTVYDAASRAVARIDPLLNRASTVFDALGRAVASINPLGNRTSTIFDKAGQAVAQVDALGKRVTTAYDLDGRPYRSVNPIGAVSTTLYDEASQAVAVIDPLGKRWSTVFDAVGRAVAQINPPGEEVRTLFDAASQTIATIDPLGLRTSFAYDRAGRQIRTENAVNAIFSTVYDEAGRISATVDPLGNRSSMVYNLADREIRRVSPVGQIATTLYDAVYRTIALIDPLGVRTSTAYDAAGNRIRSVDALNRIDTVVHDAANRPVCGIDAAGARTTTLYDKASRVTALVASNAGRTSYGYDARNLKTRSVDPLGRATSWSYDDAGRTTLRIDARTDRTSYGYDLGNRLLTKKYPDGSRVTFGYDAADRRTLARDAIGRYTALYDGKGRINSVTTPANKKITYAYDAVDQRRTMTNPDRGRTTYAHDLAGRIVALINPILERTSFTYDAASRRTSQRSAPRPGYASGTLVTSYSYDKADRTVRLANLRNGSTSLSVFAHKYDAVANKLRVVELDGSVVSWSYDNKNRLTREHRTGLSPYMLSHIYDGMGNRLVKIDDGARTSFAYDVANQLRTQKNSDGTTSFVYDANGNQHVEIAPTGRTTLSYDYENRLTSVLLPDASRSTYGYDPDGARVKTENPTEDSTETRIQIWDRENVLCETDAAGKTKVVYTLEPNLYGNLISQIRSGIPSFHVFDALGSTVALCDQCMNVTDRVVYEAYGSVRSRTGGTRTPHLWVGKFGYRFLANNRIHARRREFSTTFIRFLQKDAIGFADDYNLYAYCSNNPVTRTDPSGQWQITRDGKPHARAVAETRDSIATLARIIGLDENKWQKWLVAGNFITLARRGPTRVSTIKKDDELCSGVVLGIPNTILGLWVGDVGGIGRFWIRWDENMKWLKQRGFNVVEQLNDGSTPWTTNQLDAYYRQSTTQRSLHGFVVWGHGSQIGFGTGDGTFYELYRQAATQLQYKLALVVLNVCHGGRCTISPEQPADKGGMPYEGGQDISSMAPGSKFHGVDHVLWPVGIPKVAPKHSRNMWEIMQPGEQGTRK